MAVCPTVDLSIRGDLPLSRVRNADEFLLRFRGIRNKYEMLFAPRIAQIRGKYAGAPEQNLLDQELEIHAREYFVNAFLAALNWRLDARPEDGLPNLIPESPIRSDERSTVRFLDYLGLEKQTGNPLLIVETKRPSAPFLRLMKSVETTYSEVVSRGLAGDQLNGEWNTWLRDLGDYVRSSYNRAQKIPRRVIITNTKWLIIFLDPSDAFQEDGTCDPSRILVFKDDTEIERNFREIFLQLEYQQVLGETPALTLGELSFHLSAEAVDRMMHGLRLRYIEQPGIYHYSPVIKVAPVGFIRSRYGGWLRVEIPPKEYELPHECDRLQDHLDQVRRAAEDLIDEVNRRLSTSIGTYPLSKHYEDEDAFEALRGVVENGEDEYLVVTGETTHYVLQHPSDSSCRFHDWTVCSGAGIAANPGPVVARSTSPRSFFLSAEPHHCAHRDVTSAKATQITSVNRLRCGPRSRKESQAFCEIWSFEQHLCCRACVFGEVCTKATAFQLPC